MSKWPRIDVAVDTVLFDVLEGDVFVLLIERKNEPFKGKWAFPGGFVDEGEQLYVAAIRELKEETGIEIENLQQFYTFGDPDRDPRKRVISVAHYGFASLKDNNPKANDDAADARWFSIDDLPELAFDHEEMLVKAMNRAKLDLENQLIPEKLSSTDMNVFLNKLK